MELSDEFLEALVKRTTDELPGHFGGFYAPFLDECARHIAEWRMPGDGEWADIVDLPGVAESLLRSTLTRCADIGARTLITVLRGGALRTENAPSGYEEFHAWAASTRGRDAILGHFPELDRLLRLVAVRAARSAGEVLHAACREREPLAAMFGTGGRITSLTPGLGDAHRGGRTVTLLRWENGARAVYKPQQDDCGRLLRLLRPLLDEDGSFFGPLYPRTLAHESHLWQEYIEHTSLPGPEGAAIYFRRFGRVAALLSMMGASDLHHENVMALAEGPVLIDTETLVSLPGSPDVTLDGQPPLARELERSVLNTMLFPTRFMGATLDVDLSGVGCVRPGASRKIWSFGVVDAGTDDIRFDRVPTVVEHGSNLATVDGTPVDPRRWSDEITAGFAEAREMLRARRARVEDVIRGCERWGVRHVVRPTFVYARFIEASTHPAYLGSGQARAELFGKLPKTQRGVGAASADAIHAGEVAALLDHDVPFYRAGSDSPLLRGDCAEEVGHIAGRTPRECALSAVEAFFSRPPGRDLTYIRYALASSVDDVWDARDTIEHPDRYPDLTDTDGWRAELDDLVVGRETAQPSWLAPRLEGAGLRLGGVNAVLYDGGGLLLQLARTGTARQETNVVAACVAATAREPAVDVTVPLSVSPFTGPLSERVTHWEIRRRLAGDRPTDDEPFAAVPVGTPTHALDVDSLTAADFDYLNGYGGYLVYLAEYLEHGAPELTGVAPEKLLRRLVELDGSPEEHTGELGLAHGRFGRIAAMSALVGKGMDGDSGARDHLERFATGYLRHRWRDESLRDRGSAGGWCKGYAGVAYALVKVLGAIGRGPEEVREAVAPEVEWTLTADLGTDISLCHGVAGRIAMLCWIGDRLDWPELRVAAARLRARFLDRYGEGGWSCGIGSEPRLPSYFLGLSGWHHAQAMPEDPGVALPLCLGGR
ncbi:type 2 lanthipeptide synthetase LanM [Streptomyces himastatinicus]|uniref:type 2 lanthipeptide synthetase LanM n=1 Tax=Streptomyces himastatinicus TaxID=998084 RepID=UPI0001B4B252|nr:type 2 lanthipeptide synthetase LanM [Streptomyces himastatinicus]